MSPLASGNQDGNFRKEWKIFLDRKFKIYIIINVNIWQYVNVLLLEE
jgi:hypothetical protein